MLSFFYEVQYIRSWLLEQQEDICNVSIFLTYSVPFQFCSLLVNTVLARLFNETVRFCYEFVCLVFPTVKPKQHFEQFKLNLNDKKNQCNDDTSIVDVSRDIKGKMA